jgi:glycosyltransferase involved in cell wall biosynthesis
MRMKKIAIIGTAGVPSRYGGFETLVQNLVIQWKDQFKLYVYCSGKYYKKEERIEYWNGAKLWYLPLNSNGAQSVIYDIISIFHALFYADTLLVLGTSGGIFIPLVRIFTRKKIIVNIDGQEWKRAKWNALIRKFLKFSEFLAVRFSHADIADNAAIKKYTALNYKTLSYQIEYGADHASSVEATDEDKKQYPFLTSEYCFKVCRIEPENNVHMILEAFSKAPSKRLILIGNWQHSEYGKKLKLQYAVFPNITLMEPIYHQRTLDLIRSNCSVYIHGHSAGGTNPSLVEAMYLGLPVISFNVSYNVSTTCNKATYFKNADELIHKLNTITSYELLQNKYDMKSIADDRYTWEKIANKYACLVYAFNYNYKKRSIVNAVSSLRDRILIRKGISHLKHSKYFFE